MRSLRATILILAGLICGLNGFNLDTRFPITFREMSSSSRPMYFGYSVGLHENSDGKWLLVGAPRANISDGTDKTTEPGVIYKCSIDNQLCLQIPFHKSKHDITANNRFSNYRYSEMRDNGWLGVSLDVSSTDDPYIVACSHLWKNNYRQENYFANGMCFVADADLELQKFHRLTPLTNTFEQVRFSDSNETYYYYGLGLAGMSSHFIPNTKDLLLGAPGISDWRGMIISSDERSYGKIRQNQKFNIPPPSLESPANSYFGYSVSSGMFFNQDDTQLAVGAPREGLIGKVYVIDIPTLNDIGITIRFKKEGTQMGEYFGGAVAVVDLNNDNFADLVVGAPLHSHQRDEGKVYVYINHNEGRVFTEISPLSGSSAVGARFGTAISAVGDLNQDGFQDIAVGAPFEENVGAVYIYHGSSQGLHLVQRILPSKIGLSMKGFGISISRGKDVDNNFYLDLAVGAFETDSAAIFRSHPVIHLSNMITFSIEKISNNQKLCTIHDVLSVCFIVTPCISYSGSNAPSPISLTQTLLIGVPNHKDHRVQFNDPNIQSERNFQVNVHLGEEKCNSFEVYLINSTIDYLTPVKFYLKSEFTRDQQSLSEFCKDCPVFSPEEDGVVIKEIPFVINCGKDDVCESDLSISGGIQGIKDDSAFVVGTSGFLVLWIEIVNHGEAAYQSKTIILLPVDVSVSKLPYGCTEQQQQIICDVGNPLSKNAKTNLEIVLGLSEVKSSTSQIKFGIHCNTTSKELKENNNELDLVLRLQTDGDIFLHGQADEEQILFSSSDNITDANITKILHRYEVFKYGHTPIDSVSLEIYIPFTLEDEEDPFLQVLSINPVLNRGLNLYGDCNMTITQGNSLKNGGEDPSNPRTFILRCKETLCYFITCEMGPFIDQESAVISIDMALKLSQLKTFTDKYDVITFISRGQVIINDVGYIQSQNQYPDAAEVTTQFVKDGLPSAQKIAIWIIIICILAGILLLGLIIFILKKMGFFRRHKKEEMQKMAKEDQLIPAKPEKNNLEKQPESRSILPA